MLSRDLQMKFFRRKDQVIWLRNADTLLNPDLARFRGRRANDELSINVFLMHFDCEDTCAKLIIPVEPNGNWQVVSSTGTASCFCVTPSIRSLTQHYFFSRVPFSGIGKHFKVRKKHFDLFRNNVATRIVLCVEKNASGVFWLFSKNSRRVCMSRLIGYDAYLYELMLDKTDPNNGGIPYPREKAIKR